jgi:hypothetical protein
MLLTNNTNKSWAKTEASHGAELSVWQKKMWDCDLFW